MKDRRLLAHLDRFFRGEAASSLELELRQMENLFVLLVVGGVAGLPVVPTSVGLALVPHMEEEILAALRSDEALDDMLVTLAGRFVG